MCPHWRVPWNSTGVSSPLCAPAHPARRPALRGPSGGCHPIACSWRSTGSHPAASVTVPTSCRCLERFARGVGLSSHGSTLLGSRVNWEDWSRDVSPPATSPGQGVGGGGAGHVLLSPPQLYRGPGQGMGTWLGVVCPNEPPKVRHLLLQLLCASVPPLGPGRPRAAGDGAARAGSGLGCAAVSVPLPQGGCVTAARATGVQGHLERRGCRVRSGAWHGGAQGDQGTAAHCPAVVPAQSSQVPLSPRSGILPVPRFPLAAAAPSSSSSSFSSIPCRAPAASSSRCGGADQFLRG